MNFAFISCHIWPYRKRALRSNRRDPSRYRRGAPTFFAQHSVCMLHYKAAAASLKAFSSYLACNSKLHLYSPYVCPLCQRTSETPLLGFGVAQATLHLDMKMYDESALGMLALMFPNPPRKRHNIHTKMEALDIASILYLSLHHILYHFIHVPFISFISCAKIAFLFQRKLPVTKAKRPSIRSIWELRQKAKPFEESAVFTCCARSLCC